MLQMAIRKVGMLGRDEPSPVEEGYEGRREFLKRIGDATQAVQSASTNALLALAEFAVSLETLHTAFDSLDRVTQAPVREKTDAEIALEAEDPCTTLASALRALQAQLSDHKSMDLDTVEKFIQNEVHEPLLQIHEQHGAIEEMRHKRSRCSKAFDAARAEVAAKEREYQSKGRPIAESKLYPQLMQTLDDTQRAFATVSSDFNSATDKLIEESQLVAAQAFQASLYRIGNMLEHLSDRISGIVTLCGR